MFRSIVYSILLVTVATASVLPATESDDDAEVFVIRDPSQLEDLKAQGVELVPLNRSMERNQIRYTMGKRVSNDEMVDVKSANYQYFSKTNVKYGVQYPAYGQGAVISFVDILVDQSSNLGQAYISSGGIGQRNIIVIVEAYNTTYFNFVSKIYGV